MEILWITNTVFPAPSRMLGLSEPIFGGWMYSMAESIASTNNFSLSIASPYNGKILLQTEFLGIKYFLLPTNSKTSYQRKLEKIWLQICAELSPDIIHIHGTEYIHGLACMRACPNYNYIISIQGILSVSSRYFLAGITISDIFNNITIRDILKLDTLLNARNRFEVRGKLEREYFLRTKHVIGRTSWDYAHSKNFNQHINYYFCNESLRTDFYTAKKWNIKDKTSHTIFISQGSYPIKGLHMVILAVGLLIGDYPQIKVRIAGYNLINNSTLYQKLKLSGYASYLISLIKKFNLSNNLKFLGPLKANQMVSEYQNSHIFVCPSSIENSPNSLGEAQIIGIPCIASYVGGIPDMVEDGKTGLLYRFEEVEMLANQIRKIFEDDQIATFLSTNAIKAASSRHDPIINMNMTQNIYQEIYRYSLNKK